jgi:hypothetical protein
VSAEEYTLRPLQRHRALEMSQRLTLTRTKQPPKVNIQDRPIGKTRGAEVSLPAWAFLFAELVTYTQKRVTGISDFEKKLNAIGYRVGIRLVELLPLRDSLPVRAFGLSLAI